MSANGDTMQENGYFDDQKEQAAFDVYRDIQARTNGEIYIGVVGPVRTGKSTFIKRFMDLLVIPNIEDANSRARAVDELPQSAAGKTIMTTEPKFIPKEAAEIQLFQGDDEEGTEPQSTNGVGVKIRLIDCVGYMVEGAVGHIENEQERLVKTPWFDYEIPFTQAAEIGTRKVVNDHSTVAVVITTDGSFGELGRDSYLAAEEKTVAELKKIGKPFVLLLNTNRPYTKQTRALAAELSEKYDVAVLPVDCEQLRKEDITRIMESILSVFPVTQLDFYFPKWLEMLANDHYIKSEVIAAMRTMLEHFRQMKDIRSENFRTECKYISAFRIDRISMESGRVGVIAQIDDAFYYEIISDIVGVPIDGEYKFISIIKELAKKKQEYEKVGTACEQVKAKGYGVVTPVQEEITLEEPEIIKQGNKYGVKIRAAAPSIHMIQATIETEIAPIVGSEAQAEDLIRYMKEQEQSNQGGIWETNIFGKTMRQLVEEGLLSKVNKMTEESQMKLQETMQKIINESNGGLICIII